MRLTPRKIKYMISYNSLLLNIYICRRKIMIQKELSLSKNALNFGAMVGIVMSVIQLIAFSFNASESAVVSWTRAIILIVAISWSVRRYKEFSEGYISFGQSLGFGVLISLGASLVFAFVNYLYIKFLDPEYLIMIMEQTEIALYEAGYDDEKVKMLMDMNRMMMGPGIFAVGLVINYTILGFIASVIISFFVKNPRPMFEE